MRPKMIVEEWPPDPEWSRRFRLCEPNRQWYEAHAHEFWPKYRGLYVAVSEGDVFVADTPGEARDLALANHPDDEPFVLNVPNKRYAWIYHGCAG